MNREILDIDAVNRALELAAAGSSRRPDSNRVRQAPKPANQPPPPGSKPSASTGALLPRWEKRDLLARVSVPEVLAKFSIQPNKEDFIRCILPGHADASPSMHVTPNRAGLCCFACAQTVNALDAFGLLSGHVGSFPELCDSFGACFGVPPSNGAASPAGASSSYAKRSISPKEGSSLDPAAVAPERAKAAADDAAAEALCGPWEFVADYFYSAAVPVGDLPRGVCVWRKSRFKRTVPQASKCRAKQFRQHYTGDGGETWELKPKALPPLQPFNWYSFASISSGGVVFINEGEKAVLRLQAAGLMATCGHDAGNLKRDEAAELVKLAAFLVVIVDADKTGWKTALGILRQLCQARAVNGGEVRGIALLTLGFAYGSKKDAWDYLEEVGGADSLLSLVDSRAVFLPCEGWEGELATLEEVAAVLESDYQARQVSR